MEGYLSNENFQELSWEVLINIRHGTPFSKIFSSPIRQVTYNSFQISDNVFCIVDSSDPQAMPLNCFVWAGSEGAAKRYFLRDVESDDGLTFTPPTALLPEGADGTYESIKAHLVKRDGDAPLESAAYRIMSDGMFVHRSMETKEWAYHFRGRKDKGVGARRESPYAIVVYLQKDRYYS